MSTSTIEYLGNLRTKAIHTLSGNEIITDAPPDNHGMGMAFSPTDIVATALGSCMITLMELACKAHDIKDITGTKCEIIKHMGVNPRRIVKIGVKITFPKNFNEHDRKILETAAVTCPVAKSLHPEIIQDVHFQYPN